MASYPNMESTCATQVKQLPSVFSSDPNSNAPNFDKSCYTIMPSYLSVHEVYLYVLNTHNMDYTVLFYAKTTELMPT